MTQNLLYIKMMVSGIYSSSLSMIYQGKTLDVLANNIANVNTPGYKKDGVAFGTFYTYLEEATSKWDNIIKRAAHTYGLDRTLIEAVILVESGGNPYAISPKGAKGLMQLMDSTATRMKVKNVFDPESNIFGGTKYLKELIDEFDGDMEMALAAYNAGPGKVREYGGVPPYKETKEYVSKVLSYQERLKETNHAVQPALIPFEWTDFSGGPLEATGATLDFAIQGKGFFSISTPEGIMQTRCGSFALGPDGLLMTQQGYPVLGTAGEIMITGDNISVLRNGTIQVDGERVDRFLIQDFEKLEKLGANLFKGIGEPEEVEVSILQGYLEKANIEPMKELVSLVSALRTYEMCQKALNLLSETVGLAINQVGKVR